MRLSSKRKVVPLNIDVFPTPLKGVLRSGKKENCAKRKVSFNNDLEIRYRTASEASSNSTSKSNKNSIKRKSRQNADIHSNDHYRTYSSRILKIRKSYSPMSESENNFDELLNDKCSWSYKTLKTIKSETKKENNSVFNLRKSDLSRRTMENKDSTFNHELEDMNDDIEHEQSISDNEENVDVSLRCDNMPGSSCNYTTTNDKIISNKSKNISDGIKYDASLKKSLRNIEHKSYLESETQSNGYSSSDDEVVLQTRICNEEGKPISNIPEDNSNHTVEHMSSHYNESENYNKLCDDTSDGNFDNEQYETFDSSSGDKGRNTIIPIKNSEPNFNFHTIGQKEDDILKSSFSEKQDKKFNFTAETSSLELSSLSEPGNANDEMFKDSCMSPSNEPNTYKNCSNNLDSEIVQRCFDISSEIHSVCDDIEMPEASRLNDIVQDFFSGTLDINKYEMTARSSKNKTVFEEKYECKQNIMKNETENLNNDQESYFPILETQDSVIIDTDSDENKQRLGNDKQISVNVIKPVEKKILETIQTKSTAKKKRLEKNNLNTKQKNKGLFAGILKSNQSSNRKISTKLADEETLSDGTQSSTEKNGINQNLHMHTLYDFQNENITSTHSPETSLSNESLHTAVKENATNINVSNLELNNCKQDNQNTLQSIRKTEVDKSLHKITNKMKQGNNQIDVSNLRIMECDILGNLESVTFHESAFEFNGVESKEEKTTENLKKKNIKQRTSEINRKSKNVFSDNKRPLFTAKSKISQQRNVTDKHIKKNSSFKTSGVEQLTNEASVSFNKNNENWASNKILENTKTHHAVEEINMKKRSKTWDDLANVFSNDISSDLNTVQFHHEEQSSLSKETGNDEIGYDEFWDRIDKKYAKPQVGDAADQCLVSSNQPKSKYITKLTQKTKKKNLKTPYKKTNEVALISPNTSKINSIIKSMEQCTLPYLTSFQERQNTFLKDLEMNEDSNESPILTEYSYSIKEIQSTVHFTTGKTSSAEQFRKLVKTDETKTRMCKIKHKSVLNKNYKVQKQETLETLSKSKDRCNDKSLTTVKLKDPQLSPKQLFNRKIETKGNVSKGNTKHNILSDILAKLEVGCDTIRNQKDNIADDNENQLSNRRTMIPKKIPDFDTSISTQDTTNLSTESVEEGPYNLRKRQRKTNMDEFEDIQSSMKKLSNCNLSSKIKTCIDTNYDYATVNTNWNGESALENYNTDSSCEIVDIQNQNSNRTKRYQNRKPNSKLRVYPSSSCRKKTPESVKKELFPIKSKFQVPLNNTSASDVDDDDSIYEKGYLETPAVTNNNHANGKRSMYYNEVNTFENCDVDNSSEVAELPKYYSYQLKGNQNKEQSKKMKIENSKSNLSEYSTHKKKKAESGQTETLFPKRKFKRPLNNRDTSSVESEDKLFRKMHKTKPNTFKKENKMFSKESSPSCSTKIIQRSVKSNTTKNIPLYSSKERIPGPNFLQEQKNPNSNLQIRSLTKQNLEKKHKEDNYKKYLETIFNNSKNANKNSASNRNVLSTIVLEQCKEKGVIEDSDGNDELFSLSSSDSEDNEASSRKGDLGLLGDTLDDNEEE